MDFPLFHLDFIGNRMLVALVAITHVIVNHPMAVGAVPLAALLEWIAHRRQDAKLDELAYKFTFVFFIITTSLGALTGVGIWFTTSLVNPDAIGSLLRIFFWAWFIEWTVFVTEVCLILWYFLSWKSMSKNNKRKHIRLGFTLSVFSWITMAIITGILGFMMNSGQWAPFIREWTNNSRLLTAFLNPIYLPQLAFRTSVALMGSGLFFMFLTPFFTNRDKTRYNVIKYLSLWSLVWMVPTALSAFWYWKRIPPLMENNFPIAITTQNYTNWYHTILIIMAAMIISTIIITLVGLVRAKWLPRAIMIVPFIICIALLGYFERAREFIRKPYVIADYMYANGLMKQHYPIYKEDGILPYATFVTVKQVTPDNQYQAGRDVFLVACSRCHTVSGVNSVTKKLAKLFPGPDPWDPQQISTYIAGMHNVRPYMPPFPGSDAERDALTAFLIAHQNRTFRMEGAQTAGINQ